MSVYTNKPICTHLRVDEWRAGEVLCDGERDEPEHGEAAVPELGIGGHDATAPRLGALPLEQRHQRRDGQCCHHVGEPRLAGPACDLREEVVPARGGLHGEGGHEADHGETAVDALGCRAAERQRVPETRAARLAVVRLHRCMEREQVRITGRKVK
jgi:hypothetical protein